MRNVALLCLCFTLFSISAHAALLDSRVMAVDASEGESEVIVMAEADGRVLRADARDTVMVEALQAAVVSGVTLRFDLGLKGRINGVMQIAQDKSLVETANINKAADAAFVPSVFNTMEDAQAAFNSMSRTYKNKSQCFNRAHVWAYEMWKNRGISTSKVFIFFTRQYIRKYDFDWWFHVAPYTVVNVNGASVEHVLDRRYTAGPRDMRAWTNVFMKNDAFCPEVAKYTDYRNHQREQWCFLIKSNMYYRSPLDLELLERDGRQETGWVNSEIRAARREAFKNWRNFNP